MISSTNSSHPASFGPTVAGSFYPRNPAELRQQIQQFLQAAPKPTVAASERLVAIVAPHAGYVYSGPTAGAAYALASKTIQTAVVLSPSHHALRPYACALDAVRYKTPLGTVEIDRQAVAELMQNSAGLIQIDNEVFVPEHALDVHIPFVQVAMPNAKLVPLIVPSLSPSQLRDLGKALYQTFGHKQDTLVVTSSDLSHFYAYDQAKRIDETIMTEIEQHNLASLLENHDKRRGPCGIAPIAVSLSMLEQFPSKGVVKRLQITNSGDTAHGDRSRVVGYGALAMTVPATSP